jgi:hypothetical protein
MMVVFGSAPLLHALLDSNFNQTTGAPQKWYVWRPNGEAILSDSGGFDPTYGVERRRLTPEIARIIERQKQGLGPRPVRGDPRQLTFFDPTSGHSRLWYYQTPDGRYALFDAEGFNPENGDLLTPVTSEAVLRIKRRADEDEHQLQAEEKAIRERTEAEAKERARQQLVELFGPDNYKRGMVIVGARARHPDHGLGDQAAKQIVSAIIGRFRNKGITAAELQPRVYTSAYFDALMRGETAVLDDVGLTEKMRTAVFAIVDANCRPATSVLGVVSCTVVADVRILKSGSSSAASSKWAETGAGSNPDDAIARAADLVIERHLGLLDGA